MDRELFIVLGGIVVGWCFHIVYDIAKEKAKGRNLYKTLLIEIEQNQERLESEVQSLHGGYDAFKEKTSVKPTEHVNPEHKTEFYQTNLLHLSSLSEEKSRQIIKYYETLKDATEHMVIFNNTKDKPEGFRKQFFDMYCRGIAKALDLGRKILSQKK